MQQLKDAMNAYDVPFDVPFAGFIGSRHWPKDKFHWLNIFVEMESIYKNLQAYMQIENQYQKVMAEYLQRITYKMLGLSKICHLIIIGWRNNPNNINDLSVWNTIG